MKITRRAAVSAFAFAPFTPSFAKTCRVLADGASPLDSLADGLLKVLPETATYNGVPASLNGGPLARHMDDYTPAGEAAVRAAYKAARQHLAALRPAASDREVLYRNVVGATLDNGLRSASVPYGRINPFHFAGHVPYVVNQLAGPHIDGLNVMMEQQSLQTPQAVDAWIEKLTSFPKAFAGVIEKIR